MHETRLPFYQPVGLWRLDKLICDGCDASFLSCFEREDDGWGCTSKNITEEEPMETGI